MCRYPRAYARGTSSEPEGQLHLPLIDLFLKFYISLNHVFIDTHRRGEEPDRPELIAPIYLLEPREPRPHFPTCVRFQLANDRRHGILGRNHDDQVDVIRLDAEFLD